MLFLAFQDFLSYYINVDETTLEKYRYEYIQLYRTYCKQHHLMSNEYDVVIEDEMKKMYVQT